MKMRSVLLSVGIGFFLCSVLGGLLDDAANGIFLWLLVPSFLLVGIGGDRNVWRRTETGVTADDFFAPNS
jgi:hypothetical protein